MKKLIILVAFVLLLIPSNALAKTIDIYLFHSKTCPHCKEEINYLESYIEENDDVKLHMYEITSNLDNWNMLKKVQSVIGDSKYVPFTVIGSEYRVGFNDTTKLEIENLVNYYRENEYVDYVTEILNDNITKEEFDEFKEENKVVIDDTVDIPFLGKIDPKSASLPIIATVIGLVDGFNPCAMWILIFLITMLLNMKDKKRMWTLGLSFILTSGAVYLLFMVAWLNIVVSISSINWIRIGIGLFALGAAVFNIRNYNIERKKENGCEVVNDNKRKKIINKIKLFTNEKSFIVALLGVVALAISVNLVELACSAGLPLLFTQILALNELSTLDSSIYLLIYIFFFLLDDIMVFAIAMKTLQVTGVTTKYTKYSHLIGGIIMLLIGILLIFKPEWIMFNF